MITLREEFDDIAKGGRKLTENELSLARSVFGDKIDYDKVRIYNHKIPGLDTTAMAPNGNIYLPKSMHLDDMTISSHARGIFVHEMAHVWQHQQGRFVVGEAIGDWFKQGFNYEASYKSDPNKNNQPLADRPIEEQADIFMDHYLRQERGLESNSRRAILAAAGMDFTICPLDENITAAKNNSQPEVPQRNF